MADREVDFGLNQGGARSRTGGTASTYDAESGRKTERGAINVTGLRDKESHA